MRVVKDFYGVSPLKPHGETTCHSIVTDYVDGLEWLGVSVDDSCMSRRGFCLSDYIFSQLAISNLLLTNVLELMVVISEQYNEYVVIEVLSEVTSLLSELTVVLSEVTSLFAFMYGSLELKRLAEGTIDPSCCLHDNRDSCHRDGSDRNVGKGSSPGVDPGCDLDVDLRKDRDTGDDVIELTHMSRELETEFPSELMVPDVLDK
ncbi:hypothetical protein ACLOJK_000854 [Asimina triloba]